MLNLLAFLLQASAAAAAPTVERIDESSFRMSLPAPPGLTVAEAQARLLPAARLACRDKRPVFARYRLDGGAADAANAPSSGAHGAGGAAPAPAAPAVKAEPLLEQELLCVEAARPVAAAATPDPEWQPGDADQRALLAATYLYFAAKDSGRYGEAHAVLSDGMKRDAPLAAWSASAAEFNKEAGAPRGRRVLEITWYNNPTDAPEPGLYAAADFSAEFERFEIVCGYVMWRLQPDGSFRLVREEQNVSHRRERPVASIDRAPLRSRMGCKD